MLFEFKILLFGNDGFLNLLGEREAVGKILVSFLVVITILFIELQQVGLCQSVCLSAHSRLLTDLQSIQSFVLGQQCTRKKDNTEMCAKFRLRVFATINNKKKEPNGKKELNTTKIS